MKEAETFSDAETESRREAALKVMLATPHKPHMKSKLGRAEARPRRSRAKQPDQ